MTLPMVTAAVALFYLGAIPVRIAFRLRTGPEPRFGLGAALFEARFARARALDPLKKAPSPHAPPKELLRAARYLLRHLDSLCLDGALGTGDAALTALICGAAGSAGHALSAASGRGIRLTLCPDFSAEAPRVEATGMVSLRAGHIMLAAFLGAFDYATGRFRKWTNTPSKVS